MYTKRFKMRKISTDAGTVLVMRPITRLTANYSSPVLLSNQSWHENLIVVQYKYKL